MLFAVIGAPFIIAIILAFVGKRLGANIGYFILPIPILSFVYFLTQIGPVMQGEGASFFLPWLAAFNINVSLSLDGLSLLFALIISGVGVVVFWYSIGYLHSHERLVNFYCFLLIFMAAMLGVVCSKNLMVLYLFWEATSFSSFLLIGFWYEQTRPCYGAAKSLYITVFGGLAMLAAFILMGIIAGSFEMTDIIANSGLIKASSIYPVLVILILLGAFTKSAQVPFHIWLPDAMEAPTPISCYLHSATMVKAGIFLIALLTPVLGGTPIWFITISGVGILSLLWGAYRAMKQYDLKAILANSTISQLGLVIALIGYGSEASIAAAFFHLINHAAFKGSLFLVTGMVDHTTGSRDIRKLRGLAKIMPITAVFAGFGAMAMAGLPPFNGFLSKEMFFESSLQVVNGNLSMLGPVAWLFPVIAVIGSIFTFVYCFVILFKVFILGDLPKGLPSQPHEPAKSMLIPTGVLASLTLIIAIFPNKFAQAILEPAVNAVIGGDFHMHIAFWHGFNLPLLLTGVVIVLGLLIFRYFDKWRDGLMRLPKIVSANDIYDWLIPKGGLSRGGEMLINTHMTGRLRNYVAYTSIFFVLLVMGTMIFKGAFVISFDDLAPLSVFEALWGLAIVAACIALCVSEQPIPSIFALGIVGYSVAFFFVVFRAPDLALTQLLVESISLVLFFLAFRYLPYQSCSCAVKRLSRSHQIRNLIVSLAVGITVTLVVMVGHSNKLSQPISDYYIENAKLLAGGNNIVNVILVDFRGLDTLGEISVIALAGIGVYILISLVIKEKKKGGEHQ